MKAILDVNQQARLDGLRAALVVLAPIALLALARVWGGQGGSGLRTRMRRLGSPARRAAREAAVSSHWQARRVGACTLQPAVLRVRVPRDRPGVPDPKPIMDWKRLWRRWP